MTRAARLLACALAVAGLWLGEGARAEEPGAGIGGTGRIEPAGGIITLSGPGGRVVERVEVKVGDRVRRGAVLLLLSDQAVRALERDLAEERLRIAGRSAAQRLQAATLEAEATRVALAHARADASAVAGLDERSVPERERRQRANAVEQAEIALKLAAAKVASEQQSSEAELRIAQVNLRLARAAFDATRVTAPVDATVVEVHVQPGESLGHGPAVTLADTSRMYVVADFFEGDLPRLAPGQRARVSNNALGQPLGGAIERIGQLVDPVNRLAKAWIRLDLASPAERFIGMQVDVRIESARRAKAATP